VESSGLVSPSPRQGDDLVSAEILHDHETSTGVSGGLTNPEDLLRDPMKFGDRRRNWPPFLWGRLSPVLTKYSDKHSYIFTEEEEEEQDGRDHAHELTDEKLHEALAQGKTEKSRLPDEVKQGGKEENVGKAAHRRLQDLEKMHIKLLLQDPKRQLKNLDQTHISFMLEDKTHRLDVKNRNIVILEEAGEILPRSLSSDIFSALSLQATTSKSRTTPGKKKADLLTSTTSERLSSIVERGRKVPIHLSGGDDSGWIWSEDNEKAPRGGDLSEGGTSAR
ncbi:unnamed protein product, partial [Amoebophrya sp. A25]